MSEYARNDDSIFAEATLSMTEFSQVKLTDLGISRVLSRFLGLLGLLELRELLGILKLLELWVIKVIRVIEVIRVITLPTK